MEQASPESSVLRRSCVFCRGRKIRCSGGHICNACQERHISCVYSPEARKGRPRRKAIADRSRLSTVGTGVTKTIIKQIKVSSSKNTLENGSYANPGAQAVAVRRSNRTLGEDLQLLFNDYFINKTESSTFEFQNPVTSFEDHVLQSCADTSPSHPEPLCMDYDDLLSNMGHDMVEMLLLRVGHLGCERSEPTRRKLYVTNLAADKTASMFGRLQYQNPLTNLSKHRIMQLIDVWFSLHPLSPLVSKTLLLSQLDDGLVDEALLAIMLADAYHFHDTTTGQNGEHHHEAQKLFEFGSTQIQQRELPLGDMSALSTIQAMSFMAWREMCLGSNRRATCLGAYACLLATQQSNEWEKGARVDSRRLNGVEIGEVNKEILRNIHWLWLCTTAWGFMQIDQPFSLFAPDEISEFPCVDETASALIQLDKASDNISTLPAQTRALRRLWPLSHISSTVTHINSLFFKTRRECVSDIPPQKQHIHDLYDLLQSHSNLSTMPLEVRKALLQAIQVVESEVATTFPQLTLLTAYHSINIHLLFSEDIADQKSLQKSSLVVHAFCQSSSALLTLSQRASILVGFASSTQREEQREWVHMFVQSLDSCSRSLIYLYTQFRRLPADGQKSLTGLQEKLVYYADRLHQICKEDMVSRHGPMIRPIKKRLKSVKLAFQSLETLSIPRVLCPYQSFGNGVADPTMAWIPGPSLANDFLPPPTNDQGADMSFLFTSAPSIGTCDTPLTFDIFSDSSPEPNNPCFVINDHMQQLSNHPVPNNANIQSCLRSPNPPKDKQRIEASPYIHSPGNLLLCDDSTGKGTNMLPNNPSNILDQHSTTSSRLEELNPFSSDLLALVDTDHIGIDLREEDLDIDPGLQINSLDGLKDILS
ncbi:hypothetical protein BDV25DRAFT_165000 [Aspergillus avenaceus]|uniref:Zn(2)-C6 fungal-type domain-containing protein n=1 Tax=Aspergillus avenaceus TaxID=36643 RepID=A0A5N6TGE2_ASPAV|nr:hypothetical protein BDV25DRAFT_165000 [Aspergillus avenaceus]